MTLAEIRLDIEAATNSVRQLERALSMEAWNRPGKGGGWSAAKCIEHLNITSRALLPLLTDAIGEAQKLPAKRGRYRLNLIAWMLVKSLGSRKQFAKSKTPPRFVPEPIADVPDTLLEFYRLQEELLRLLASSEGLAIDKVKIHSLFNDRVRYSVYSAFRILAVHEHRHIEQAERAAGIVSERAAR